MHSLVDDESLLGLWERAVALPAGASDSSRADALLAAGESGPVGLGERNRRLIDMHCRLFGRTLALISCCPACGAAAQFDADAAALATQIEAAEFAASHRLDCGVHEISFRLPQAKDVAAAGAGSGDGASFARQLLQRCVVSVRLAGAPQGEGDALPFDSLPISALDALSQRIEAIDPGASIAFDVACPNCAKRWSAPLDMAQLLWRKVQAAAEGLLLEIDALARAYGWSERQILRLTPLRRAAYLQMVSA